MFKSCCNTKVALYWFAIEFIIFVPSGLVQFFVIVRLVGSSVSFIITCDDGAPFSFVMPPSIIIVIGGAILYPRGAVLSVIVYVPFGKEICPFRLKFSEPIVGFVSLPLESVIP